VNLGPAREVGLPPAQSPPQGTAWRQGEDRPFRALSG
jgi:hypothetical protein